MQDIWYGDDRDLVKWAALVHLAVREHLCVIVQVALFRRGERPTLKTKSGPLVIPERVWTHFCQLRNIRTLGKSYGLKIRVIEDTFDHKARRNYFSRVAGILRRMKFPKAVLLDPDTGLKPREAKAKHVTRDEICTTWSTLAKGDWLILYQHRWRDKRWRTVARERFASACGGSEVEVIRALTRPRDVIFLAARKD